MRNCSIKYIDYSTGYDAFLRVNLPLRQYTFYRSKRSMEVTKLLVYLDKKK